MFESMPSRVHATLSLFLAAALTTVPVAAQERPPDEVREELTRRVEELIPIEREAASQADRAREARELEARLAASAEVDTINVNGLTVVALPGQVELAERLFRQSFQKYGAYASSPAFDGVVVSFQWGADLKPIYLEGADHRRVEHGLWRTQGYMQRQIERGIEMILAKDLEGTELQRWASTGVASPDDLSHTYRELVTAASTATRSCIEGDGMACWVALGLDVPPDMVGKGSLDSWYSPEERVLLVQSRYRRWGRASASDPNLTGCLVESIPAECDRLLRQEGWITGNSWLAPLGVEARATMRWIAVELGGEGAWDRMREKAHELAEVTREDRSGMTPQQRIQSMERSMAATSYGAGEALRYASGMTSEELGLAWRDRVLQHRPVVYAEGIPSKLSALMWMVLFSALALRSTRWRLG